MTNKLSKADKKPYKRAIEADYNEDEAKLVFGKPAKHPLNKTRTQVVLVERESDNTAELLVAGVAGFFLGDLF